MVAFEFYICTMLNFGIIGDLKLLEPYIKHVQKLKNVQVIGKSSVGINVQPESFQFTIPEFNRIELMSRSDVLLISNFSLFPFAILCEMVKNSKHIFAVEYPKLTVEECQQLIKLTGEAKTVFQIVNPFYYLPAVQWLNDNLNFPAFLDVTYFNTGFHKKNSLFALLLMLKHISGFDAKKIGAVTFQPAQNNFEFYNLRLEFGDASVVNINCGRVETANEFKIKAFTKEQFVSLNFINKTFTCNNSSIDLKNYLHIHEFDNFMNAVLNNNKKVTGMQDYHDVLQAVNKIEKKITQFSGE